MTQIRVLKDRILLKDRERSFVIPVLRNMSGPPGETDWVDAQQCEMMITSLAGLSPRIECARLAQEHLGFLQRGEDRGSYLLLDWDHKRDSGTFLRLQGIRVLDVKGKYLRKSSYTFFQMKNPILSIQVSKEGLL